MVKWRAIRGKAEVTNDPPRELQVGFECFPIVPRTYSGSATESGMGMRHFSIDPTNAAPIDDILYH
jgi:hypothetical protein